MSHRAPRFVTAGILGTLLLTATACGSDKKADTAVAASNTVAAATTVAPTVAPVVADTTPAPAPTVAATVAPTADTTPATNPPAAQAGGKVNINEASISELEVAYKAAGVTNPRRWAQETDEYRPYPTDEKFAKLRQELGKYNIDPAILELIISTLEF